ncbi:MAG TPA: hypothetical protein VIG44_01215 [Thermomicrobiales bacterium]|jgi:hypothetical protein
MPSIRYTGDGSEFHFSIPARDLTSEEYDALDTDQRALVRKSPLYDYAAYHEAVTPPTPAKEPQRDPAPAEDVKATKK